LALKGLSLWYDPAEKGRFSKNKIKLPGTHQSTIVPNFNMIAPFFISLSYPELFRKTYLKGPKRKILK